MGRKKRFCSNECRRAWWSENRDKINMSSEAQYKTTCEGCGKQFVAYGNPNRKYCSHECYINYRYWNGNRPTVEKDSHLYTDAPVITLMAT